jgi:hypothetical protein
MTHTHKLLFLLVAPGIWSVLFLIVRFGGLTLDKLRPWGRFFLIASMAVWIVLFVLDSPFADLAMELALSLTMFFEWTAWFERRAKRAS